MIAVERDRQEIAKLLLGRGAGKDLKDLDGKTAFDYAHSQEMRDLLKMDDEVVKHASINKKVSKAGGIQKVKAVSHQDFSQTAFLLKAGRESR